MRAVVITSPGGVEALDVREVEPPQLTSVTDVRVRVHAAGLNRADILQRRGQYPAPLGYPQDIPGLEFAGQVESVSTEAHRWKIGERVFGLTAGGAQAELVVVDETNLAAIPTELNWVEAAAMPEVFVTAHDALFTRAKLKRGETILIHAAASGVGTAAVQLAHATSVTVFGTSRTAEKLERIRDLGLNQSAILGDTPEEFVTAVKEWTHAHGVDVILDLVGGRCFPFNVQALAVHGRLICVGTTAGAKSEIDIGLLMRKRATIMGPVLRPRSVAEKAEAIRRFADEILPLVRRGVVRPVIEAAYQIDEVRAAHKHLESNRTIGKVILTFS